MLAAHDVSFASGARSLVAEVSLELRPGELVVIAGPNGAGKSTLLKLLCNEIAPTAGRVTVNGSELGRISALARARTVAVLPQESRLTFPFTGLEVALFGRHPHRGGLLAREDREIAYAALELADAAHLAERDFTTLSGGEKARVHLSRVLAQAWMSTSDAQSSPRYILLDEPTAALDLKHQHATLAVAKAFARRDGGVGVLAVLHDLNLAAQFADRLVLMKEGRLVANGSPTEVLSANRIADVFDVEAQVLSHPGSGTPLVAVLQKSTEAHRGSLRPSEVHLSPLRP